MVRVDSIFLTSFYCFIVECFKPYFETKEEKGNEEDDVEKPKSIFERDDLFKDPVSPK